MSYTPRSISSEQGLFDITRILLQQPDLCALVQAIKAHVQQLKLADPSYTFTSRCITLSLPRI